VIPKLKQTKTMNATKDNLKTSLHLIGMLQVVTTTRSMATAIVAVVSLGS